MAAFHRLEQSDVRIEGDYVQVWDDGHDDWICWTPYSFLALGYTPVDGDAAAQAMFEYIREMRTAQRKQRQQDTD